MRETRTASGKTTASDRQQNERPGCGVRGSGKKVSTYLILLTGFFREWSASEWPLRCATLIDCLISISIRAMQVSYLRLRDDDLVQMYFSTVSQSCQSVVLVLLLDRPTSRQWSTSPIEHR